MTAALIATAEHHLSRVDPRLAALIQRHGPCTLTHSRRDPFHVLCNSIISQQLSVKAADTILKRVMIRADASKRLTPDQVLSITLTDLRTCGLSNAKASWLHSISTQVQSGAFSFARLKKMDDAAATAALDALPGVGLWTAEMYLIFALHRLDIFSMGDVGLRRSLDHLYNKGRKLSDARTLKITQTWAPYRSVGSWYLWKMADGDSAAWA